MYRSEWHLLNKGAANERRLHFPARLDVVNEFQSILFLAHLKELWVSDLAEFVICSVVSLVKDHGVLLLGTNVTLLLLRIVIVNVPPLELVVQLEEPLLHVFVLRGVLVKYDLRDVPFSVQNEVVH